MAISEGQVRKRSVEAVKLKGKKNIKQVKPAFLGNLGLSLVLPVTLILFWEIVTRFNYVESHLLPAPSDIVQVITSMASEGTLWQHSWITLYRIFWGFVWGSLAAVALGSLVGMSRKLEMLFDPLIQAFRAIPSLAWVPLFILWLGIGEPSKVTLIAVGVFFPVYLNIVGGIQSVDRKLIEVGKTYGFSSFQLVRRIILPASMPSFLTGLRSGLGLGWMFVVAAELMGASQGLGYLLVLGQNTLQPELILASIILFAVLGKMTDYILKRVQTRALHWQDRIDVSK
ncbi:ABC transporter permease [Salipaludibacillus agaradhaerens]|uniref:ABC transporter permease n=1 Tax=Salipaludibacillus agaradhaerens TaxID=76935 RepID=A0A9Q4AYF2_SALAG|nr:ABC transporter permease [Salipaludibacillus agaradhaerens]MCR6095196.1 ABC transporter permease [Salipaludibacillus agaradhaerens]MCR6115246.1 ABC transporter permease [Salipaludibacillus agaradhaerens]